MVMQNISPKARCSSANGIPEIISQIMLSMREGAPPPYLISFLNGKKLIDANLKHCSPHGIPIIVMHQIIPAKNQLKPHIRPPNKNQIILPIVRIALFLSFSFAIRKTRRFSAISPDGTFSDSEARQALRYIHCHMPFSAFPCRYTAHCRRLLPILCSNPLPILTRKATLHCLCA